MNATGARAAEKWTQHAGKHVRVFVSVDVSDVKAAGLQVLDLGCGFDLDFFGADAAGEQAAEKHGEPWDKVICGCFEQRRDLSGREDRFVVAEDDVAADAESRRGARNFDGLIGGRGASHERGAGEQTRLVKFEDGAVNSRGLAKVVSVDDETGHGFDADTERASPSQ